MRRAEQLRFAHELDVCPQCEDQTQEEHKVPVRGVRCADQDEFWQVGECPVHAPAEYPHDDPREDVEDVTENGGVENGCFHWRNYKTLVGTCHSIEGHTRTHRT